MMTLPLTLSEVLKFVRTHMDKTTLTKIIYFLQGNLHRPNVSLHIYVYIRYTFNFSYHIR